MAATSEARLPTRRYPFAGAGSLLLPHAAAKTARDRMAILRMKPPVESGVEGCGASSPRQKCEPSTTFLKPPRRENRPLEGPGAFRQARGMRVPAQAKDRG